MAYEISLSPELQREIESIAKKQNKSVQDIIEELVIAYLEDEIEDFVE